MLEAHQNRRGADVIRKLMLTSAQSISASPSTTHGSSPAMYRGGPSSRLLKKSVSFADEACLIRLVDEDVSNEPAGGLEGDRTATAGLVAVVGALPGEQCCQSTGPAGSRNCSIV